MPTALRQAIWPAIDAVPTEIICHSPPIGSASTPPPPSTFQAMLKSALGEAGCVQAVANVPKRMFGVALGSDDCGVPTAEKVPEPMVVGRYQRVR